MKVKKILSLLLAAVMLLSFAACSGGSGKTVAELNQIFEDGSLKQYYLKNPETFMAAAQEEISSRKTVVLPSQAKNQPNS